MTRIERAEQLRDAELGAAAERRAQDGSGRELAALHERYSLSGALASLLPGGAAVDAAAENEVAAELRAANPGRKWRGLPVPSEVFRVRPDQLPARLEQRASDFVVGGGSPLAATSYRPDLFIDLFRAQLLSAALGVRVLDGLEGSGAVSILKQLTGSSAFWVPEDGDVGHATGTFGSATLTPHTIGVQATLSRRMIVSSSPAIEGLIRSDLAAAVAEAVDAALLNGDPTANAPKGLLRFGTNGDGLNVVALGTNGAALTYASLVTMYGAPRRKNVPTARLGWLSSSRVTEQLLTLLRVPADAAGGFALNLDTAGDVPRLMGRPYFETELVPASLTKGTGSNLTALAFGDWSECVIGMWSALDVIVDPYTAAASGGVRIVVLRDCDIAFRRLQAFAVAKDVVAA